MAPRRTEIDPEDSDLKYDQLAGILRGRIESGELAPRRAVPSKKTLSEQYGIATGTAEKALQILHEEGLIKPVRGKTYYVTEPDERQAPPG